MERERTDPEGAEEHDAMFSRRGKDQRALNRRNVEDRNPEGSDQLPIKLPGA